MEVATLREKLHEYINLADEEHLSAIYVMVEGNMPLMEEIFDESTMNMLYQRREDHRNGISKSYTAEESIRLIQEHKNR